MTEAHDRDPVEPDLDAAVAERRVLLGLCYRLLGSIADAEDAVQETYVRWYRQTDDERGTITSPRSWLMKTAGRICLDMLGSARARREQYVGEWLPEPIPDAALWTSQSAGPIDPSDRVTLDDSVSMAMLVVLDAMTPAERVAFILHDVFRYTFAEVGDIVGRSPEAARQLASSARRRVRDSGGAPRHDERHLAVVRSFKSALQTGDVSALVALLDPDAVSVADGGGLATAALQPIRGAQRIVQHFLAVFRGRPDVEFRESVVNGDPGLVVEADGKIVTVIALGISDDGRISRIWAVRNPEKLRAWA
jgi:RNA polymerase sigma factor (sigma-70 family)